MLQFGLHRVRYGGASSHLCAALSIRRDRTMQRLAVVVEERGMHRPSIVMPPPLTHDRHHRELAMGMRQIWASALYAAGADLFAPHRDLDPALDPFVSIAGERGISLTHDQQPPTGQIDVMVLTELQYTADGWRVPIRVLEPGRFATPLPARAHRGTSGVLDAMVTALHTIGIAVELELPKGIGWRDLLFAHTIAEGLRSLAQAGRATPRIADPMPPPLLQ